MLEADRLHKIEVIKHRIRFTILDKLIQCATKNNVRFLVHAGIIFCKVIWMATVC